jgi:flagellar biosynthesis/type III secretory pathway protein FliH
MMKMFKVLAVLSIVFLSGCSLLEGVNSSLQYANDAKDYINEASTFAEELPALAEEAVNNEEARTELEQSLNNMKEEINTFKESDAPEIAEDAHNQLVSYSESLESGIDSALKQIENGEWNLQLLEDTEIVKTVSEMKSILDQIEQLGS